MFFGRYRFYCPDCHHFLDRRQVKVDEYELIYFCKVHDCPVIQTKLVFVSWLEEIIKKIIEKGAEDEFI